MADAFSKDGKQFTLLAADKLTAFLELERQVLKQAEKHLPRHWEIIADNLSKAGWSLSSVSAERSGLLTHSAATQGALLYTLMKS